MNRLFAIILFVFISGCQSSRISTCENYFESCNKKTQFPTCEELSYSNPRNSDFSFPTRFLVGEIDSAEVRKHIDETPFLINEFITEAKDAESFWYYDASGKDDSGMYIGTEGVIALKDCTILSSFPIVIYN